MPHHPSLHTRKERSSPSWWQLLGMVAAVALVIAALVWIAVLVLVVIGMNNFGSNK